MALRIRYQTLEFEGFDIHLRTLRDRQEYEDPDGEAERLGISSAQWPLFGVVWDSSRVLAEILSHREVDGLRILEVGCGIGLASLVLNEREADITATDRHPEVGVFLDANTDLNDAVPIPFVRTGWTDLAAGEELGEFDLIVGSDLLYEEESVRELADFVGRHARPICTLLLVDPGRGHSNAFRRAMEVQDFHHDQRKATEAEHPPSGDFSGRIHRFRRGFPGLDVPELAAS